MNRVICVVRDGMDYSRTVFDWLEDFRRKTGREIEVMDPDTNPGFCQSYDIMVYPTIIVLDGRGAVLASWRGIELPLMDEVNYYFCN